MCLLQAQQAAALHHAHDGGPERLTGFVTRMGNADDLRRVRETDWSICSTWADRLIDRFGPDVLAREVPV